MKCPVGCAWNSRVLALMTFTVLTGCGTSTFVSRWKGPDVVIGRNEDAWLTSAIPVEDKRISLAVFNDSEYVYIGLVTADRDLQRLITRGGVTWWFDREGGDRKTFGVHYPVLSRPTVPAEAEAGEGDAPPRDSQEADRTSHSGEMDLYTSGEAHPVRMTVAATAGIDAGYQITNGTLSYVLRVPLRDRGSHPFALNVAPGTLIGVGVESAIRRLALDAGSEGRRPAGGGIPGGRRGGGGRGERPQGRPEVGSRPAPLHAWMKIQLSTHE